MQNKFEHNPSETLKKRIKDIIEFIGDDPDRQGLQETPERVIRSFGCLFEGYMINPSELIKTFKEKKRHDQLILMKHIQFYSTCEHHMLPFFGKAHVGYIPDPTTGRVIGASKLIRILNAYARRLQIQERIGDQVTSLLMQELKAIGAACIIEAKHLCIGCRGVENQTAIMDTSSLKGVFRQHDLQGVAARNELMLRIQNGK